MKLGRVALAAWDMSRRHLSRAASTLKLATDHEHNLTCLVLAAILAPALTENSSFLRHLAAADSHLANLFPNPKPLQLIAPFLDQSVHRTSQDKGKIHR